MDRCDKVEDAWLRSGLRAVMWWTLSLLAMAMIGSVDAAEVRQVLPLDQDWRFHLGDVAGAEKPEMADAEWRLLDVPHDYSIEGPVGADPATMEGPFDQKCPGGKSAGFLNGGIAWYRKTFTLPVEAVGRRMSVEFDGVFMDSQVWLNGAAVGRQPYGYSSFQFDLTPHLKSGNNILAVKVTMQQPCSRWYPGAGIYRHVRLVVMDPVHVAHWGTQVTTPEIQDAAAKVQVRTRVQNDGKVNVAIALTTSILNAEGKKVAEHRAAGEIGASGTNEFVQVMNVDAPSRWSLENPVLYRAISEVMVGEKVVDCYETPFGIRSIKFTPDNGFLLNGKRVQLKGVCNHHDLGCLGSAVHRRAIERQIEILKGMGCNAIRTSHNPPAPELLDLCDRMGILVIDEIFDEWLVPKTGMTYGYTRFFNEWSEHDVVSMVRRDRNHPSVILWSIGNEIKEQRAPQGGAMAKRLADFCRREDPSRMVSSGCNFAGNAAQNGFLDALDVIGINYHTGDYEAFRGKLLYGSETSSALSTRGEPGLRIKPDGKVEIDTRPNNRVTSYDVTAVGWGCSAEGSLLAIKASPWVAGEFVWTGFDYIGEPTPYRWPSRSSYFGIIDLAGFPKDRYYLYQSQWAGNLMVYLMPHWNWKGFEGKEIPVWCYTSAESVELFLNGRSLGSKDFKDNKTLHLDWNVPYEPGVLKAVGKKGGQTVSFEVRTAGAPARLVVSPDRKLIAADGEDLSFVEVRVVDKDGNVCPDAENLITFGIEGPGSIVGVDNGDPINHESFKGTKHKAFHGLCLAVIESKRVPGEIRLDVTAQGLQSEPVVIRTEKSPAGVAR